MATLQKQVTNRCCVAIYSRKQEL